MRERATLAEEAAATEVTLHDGIHPALDAAADAADPRHVFLRAAWFAADAGGGTSTLVARRANGGIVAALPIGPAGPRILGLRAVPGSYWPFRSFPVAADATDAELRAFLSAPAARRTLGRAWRLGPATSDDPTFIRLLRIARCAGWHALLRRAGTTFVLDIAEARRTGPWPRPSTVRNNHKHDKRLARLGPIGWRHVRGGEWGDAAFDDLAAIERNSWLAHTSGADPKFLHKDRLARWKAAMSDPAIAACASAGILSIGEVPVSFSFGIDAGGTRYCIATSFDDRFARHSPGSVTGYRTYAEAADRGVDRLNLGTGDSGQKSGMGAVPGPEMLDCLFVRNRVLASLLSPVWRAGVTGTRRGCGRLRANEGGSGLTAQNRSG